MPTTGKAAKSQTGATIHTLEVKTSRRTELVDVTREVERLVAEAGCTNGSCQLYVPHSTAGVIINEGDDPAVARDIETTLDRMVPRAGDYRHAEGNSDSHIKTAIVGVSETVWIEDGRLALGRWQAIFFCEFDGPRRRELRVKIVSD
ncbi:MAG: secondary thiamine-phosphate synthase enzyme YjbQ [Candidatus Acidiferrales bacterium]